MPPKQLRHQLQ